MQRYPTDLVVTQKDFAESGWREVLAGADREGYSSLWQVFSDAARQAITDGQSVQGKVLWLLADACSMRLVPGSFNDPFKPFMVMEGKRSVIPDDFEETDIALFTEIYESVDEPWLAARLADLVWLKALPRNTTVALAAIDAYRRVPLDGETWTRNGRECWERAVELAKWLKGKATTQLEEIESSILAAFDLASLEHGYFAYWLAELMLVNRLCTDRRELIADKLATLAEVFRTEGDIHRARAYFKLASEYFGRLSDIESAARMRVAEAETWVAEADAMLTMQQPLHVSAVGNFEKAIQVYRSVPKSERGVHRVEERMKELGGRLAHFGEKALGDMGTIRTPMQDLSELADHSRNAVKGKDAVSAIREFANLVAAPGLRVRREQAEQHFREFPLQGLFGRTLMSRDGRVIAKCPSVGFSSEPSAETEVALRARMIEDYKLWIQLVVKGEIMPALWTIILEHRLRVEDFISLADSSPIVPEGRHRLMGKALFAGYELSFDTALHLLVPQLEHMVRFHLKHAGAATTILDKQGIKNVVGMSTLMELPEADQVFGEDLAFELRSLFCDAFGPNLRNELAHGLLDDGESQSAYAVYAWWLSFRLVFNTYLNRIGAEQNQKEPAAVAKDD